MKFKLILWYLFFYQCGVHTSDIVGLQTVDISAIAGFMLLTILGGVLVHTSDIVGFILLTLWVSFILLTFWGSHVYH